MACVRYLRNFAVPDGPVFASPWFAVSQFDFSRLSSSLCPLAFKPPRRVRRPWFTALQSAPWPPDRRSRRQHLQRSCTGMLRFGEARGWFCVFVRIRDWCASGYHEHGIVRTTTHAFSYVMIRPRAPQKKQASNKLASFVSVKRLLLSYHKLCLRGTSYVAVAGSISPVSQGQRGSGGGSARGFRGAVVWTHIIRMSLSCLCYF